MTPAMACSVPVPILLIHNMYDSLPKDGEDMYDFLPKVGEDIFVNEVTKMNVMKTDELIVLPDAFAIKPARLLSLGIATDSCVNPLISTNSVPIQSCVTVMKPSLSNALSQPKVGNENSKKRDVLAMSEKSIYTYILAMRLDSQEQLKKFCQSVNSKCTTSTMLYAKQQVPLKVKTPALLMFRSVGADLMLKINANLPVTHIATVK